MLEELDINKEEHKKIFLNIIHDPVVTKYIKAGDIIDFLSLKIIKKYVYIPNETPIGLIFLIPLREKEVELRYCISSEFRGQGYAKMMVEEVMKRIGDNITVYANVQSENIASAKALINSGFNFLDNYTYTIKK